MTPAACAGGPPRPAPGGSARSRSRPRAGAGRRRRDRGRSGSGTRAGRACSRACCPAGTGLSARRFWAVAGHGVSSSGRRGRSAAPDSTEERARVGCQPATAPAWFARRRTARRLAELVMALDQAHVPRRRQGDQLGAGDRPGHELAGLGQAGRVAVAGDDGGRDGDRGEGRGRVVLEHREHPAGEDVGPGVGHEPRGEVELAAGLGARRTTACASIGAPSRSGSSSSSSARPAARARSSGTARGRAPASRSPCRSRPPWSSARGWCRWCGPGPARRRAARAPRGRAGRRSA